MEQRRYKEASAELAHVLSAAPQSAVATSMLAYCELRLGDPKRAKETAQRGVGLDPSSSYGYRILAHVCFALNDPIAAEKACREALRISPEQAETLGLLALSLGTQSKWAEAISTADRGLKSNPNELNCLNSRIQALGVLGRTLEVDVAVQAVMREHSEDALAHEYAAWAFLRTKRVDKAIEHFREALRLNPNSEAARRGMIEALRSRFPVYRALIGAQAMLFRIPRGARSALLLGIYVVVRILAATAKDMPTGLMIASMSLAALYFAFVLFSWIGGSLINITLLMHPLGRIALRRSEKLEAICLAVALAVSISCISIGATTARSTISLGGVVAAFGVVITALLSRADPQKGKTAIVCAFGYTFAAAGLVCGLAGMAGY
jgi:tetratricopeptide (TPR) repeat protein